MSLQPLFLPLFFFPPSTKSSSQKAGLSSMTRTMTILLPPPPGSPSPTETFKMFKLAPNPSSLGKKVHADSWFPADGNVAHGHSLHPIPLQQPPRSRHHSAAFSPEGAVLQSPIQEEEGNYWSRAAGRAPGWNNWKHTGIQYLVSNSLIHTFRFCQSNLSASTWSCTISDFSLC